MDIAFCTQDQKRYQAEEFAELDPPTLAARRRQLICVSCEGLAFFRKASVSGQAACFGARPHLSGCELAVTADTDSGLLADEDERDNNGRRFKLDMSTTARERRNVVEVLDDEDAEPRGRRYAGTGSHRRSRTEMNLMAALRRLVRAKSFRTSDSVIELPGGQEQLVRNFFVQIDDVGAEMVNELRGYWGAIYDVGHTGSVYWLNAKGSSKISFRVDDAQMTALLRRARVDEPDDLAGASILAYAWLRRSTRSTKLLIALNENVPFVVRHERMDAWEN